MRRMIIVAAMLLWTSAVSHAHPHVFVNAQAGFQLDEKSRLQSLRISWRYDAFTTLFIFDALDLDSDRDGQLNEQDLAAVAAAETEWPPDYNGDVYLAVGDKNWKLARPKNAAAQMVDGEITVSFDLPLETPVALSKQRASLRLYDPFYYYSYTVTVDKDSQNMESPCKATAIPFEPDAAAAETLLLLANLSREETPSDPNIGAQFADEIVLACS